MNIGLHASNFTWPGSPPALRPHLARVAMTAEEEGFARLSVTADTNRIASQRSRQGDGAPRAPASQGASERPASPSPSFHRTPRASHQEEHR